VKRCQFKDCRSAGLYVVCEVKLAPGKVLRMPCKTWRCVQHEGLVPIEELDQWREWIRSEIQRRGHDVSKVPATDFVWGGSRLTEPEAQHLEQEWDHLGLTVDQGATRVPVEHVPWKDFDRAVREHTKGN
jgi:hypothetical protein